MKATSFCSIAILSLSLTSTAVLAQTPAASTTKQSSPASQTPAVPLDKAVTATAHQAWVLGGRTRDGFFAIVQELADFSARNRGVTLPDNQQAGARAGEWIRDQAMKDPDQLLYAIVDEAVQHSISSGEAKPITTARQARAQ